MASQAAPAITLASLSERFDLVLQADDPRASITGVCALTPGRAGCLTFAETASQAEALARSEAGAAIVSAELAVHAVMPVFVCSQPRLAFARMAALFEPVPEHVGVHASAVIGTACRIDASASIGPNVVIGNDGMIGPDAVIDANTVIGTQAVIGARVHVGTNCSIGDRVEIGEDSRVEANAVIGARGFGLVHNGAGWEAIPQMGRVRIGSAVEIGAGSTIDRGALDDTVIGDGVKIDDQVHIGHNCVIGAHTVIAGCTGIAGSCTIGANCMIGGGVGIGDHLTIVDGVIITAASQVPKNIETSGVYSSTFRAMPARIWRKRLALFRQLDRIDQRLRRVERAATPTGDK